MGRAGTTGQDIEDASTTPPRTIAECLLHHLITHDDTLPEEDRLFSRPLAVTAPRGYFVYTGSLAVSPCSSGQGKQDVFKMGGKDLSKFVTHKWRLSDLRKETMLIATAK